DLQLDAEARGDIGHATLSGSARRGGNGLWRGALDALQVAPAVGTTWRLQSTAAFAQAAGGRWTLSPACLAPGVGGHLCARADWPRQGLSIDGEQLPLAL